MFVNLAVLKSWFVEDVPDLRPGAGEVVVRVHAAGVNPVEAYIRTGTYAMKPALPYTPGADGAGEVLAVGEGVKTVKPGDRVYVAGSLSGTYAQQSLCRDAQVHPLPNKSPSSRVRPLAYLTRPPSADCSKERTLCRESHVLVHGASGGVGIAAVQMARAHGMLVIGTAGSDKGRQLVRE